MFLEYKALKKDEGRELKSVLRKELKLSASLIRKLKAKGGILVNSRPEFTNFRLTEGDLISCDLEAAENESDVLPEYGNVDILFEDEWLIAVNKPSGQLTHPSRAKYTGTLANYVAGYLGGVCHAVNRLDRDTSGVVLFAKSSHAKARAAEALADCAAAKEYYALVYGAFSEKSGVIDAPIKRLREMDMMRGVCEDGDRAVTKYRAVKEYSRFGDAVTLIHIELETGRTHQIRVHFAHIGHPLIGDILYYSNASRELSNKLGIAAQALHAFRQVFIHPFTGAAIELCCKVKREELKPFFDGNMD